MWRWREKIKINCRHSHASLIFCVLDCLLHCIENDFKDWTAYAAGCSICIDARATRSKRRKIKNRCAHWNRMKTRGSRSRHLTSILFRKTYLACSRCSLFATRPVEDTSIGLSETQKSNWFIDVVCVNVNETKQLLSSCKKNECELPFA